MSVTAGQRYWLQLDCPAPTGGAKGCAVGARFHTEDAPYPLTLTARKLAGRTKGSISCAAITDRDDCCAALDSDDNPCVPAVVPLTPTLTLALTQSLILTLTLTRTRTLTLARCVPAVVRFSAVVGTPVCLDAATAASVDHRSQVSR